jgi:hypothetical protein
VDVIGVHYPLDNGKITTTDVARRSGKPLWASEDQPNSGAGPIQQRTWPLGGRILAHLYNRNYLEGSMTKTESVLHPAGGTKAGADRPDDSICREQSMSHDVSGSSLWRYLGRRYRLRIVRFLCAGQVCRAKVSKFNGRGASCSVPSPERHAVQPEQIDRQALL